MPGGCRYVLRWPSVLPAIVLPSLSWMQLLLEFSLLVTMFTTRHDRIGCVYISLVQDLSTARIFVVLRILPHYEKSTPEDIRSRQPRDSVRNLHNRTSSIHGLLCHNSEAVGNSLPSRYRSLFSPCASSGSFRSGSVAAHLTERDPRPSTTADISLLIFDILPTQMPPSSHYTSTPRSKTIFPTLSKHYPPIIS